MAHPRNMPKQDLKTQYYSPRRSSVALNSNSSSSPNSAAGAGVFSPASPSISSPLKFTITARQEAMMDDKRDQTVERLMNRAGKVLKEWKIKNGTPTPTMRVRTAAEEEVKKATPSPTPKLRTEAGYYRDWDGKVKPAAVVEMPMSEEMGPMEQGEAELMEDTERENLTKIVEDDVDAAAMGEKMDEVRRRIEGLNTIDETKTAPPVPVALQPIQEELPSSPTPPPQEQNPSAPADHSSPSHSLVKEPKPAANTPIKVSAPAGAPKQLIKPKIHDWLCTSHKSSTSTLAPYKCIKCTKRRAASKSLLKK